MREKQFIVVSYDIRDEERLRKVALGKLQK